MGDVERSRALLRSKRLATGLLLLAGVIFVIVHRLEPDHAWLGYVRATAEAAMVGAVADWFAVTALFRHPLGLPIPHTAILPRNKDALGDSLGRFVSEQFLSESAVRERVSSLSLAARIGAWLRDPAHARRAAESSARALVGVLTVLRDEQVQEVLEHTVVTRIRATPAAPAAGRALGFVMDGGHHGPLLDELLANGSRLLDERRSEIEAMLTREAPWWLPRNVEHLIFERSFEALRTLLAAARDDPEHELRREIEAGLVRLADDLQHSPELAAKGEQLKEDVLAHPGLSSWIGSLWSRTKAALLEALSGSDELLLGRFEHLFRDLGERFEREPALRDKVDGWIESSAAFIAREHGHEVAALIASTVERWDADETSRRIELQVGRDLQLIRVNGTLVGGLVGLLIYIVAQQI